MKKINNHGFSHVETLIFIVIVIIVSAIGFYVFKRSNKDSQAETAVKPVPVYRIRVNYPNTKVLNYYKYAVGTAEMKRFVNANKSTAKNHGVAFLGFPKKKAGSNDLSITLHRAEKTTSSALRTDARQLGNRTTRTIVFTTSDAVKQSLVKNYGFRTSSLRVRVLPGKSIYYHDLTPLVRVWKRVLRGGSRIYQYPSNKAHFKSLLASGYKLDSEVVYSPAIKKYCNMRNDRKFGEICIPKRYQLPDLARFRAYITALERDRLADEARARALLASNTYDGSNVQTFPPDVVQPHHGGNGGGSGNDASHRPNRNPDDFDNGYDGGIYYDPDWPDCYIYPDHVTSHCR